MARCVRHVELASLEDNAVGADPQWLNGHISFEVQVGLGPLHSHLDLLAERWQLSDDVRWADETWCWVFWKEFRG
jgi:hypothetical protein